MQGQQSNMQDEQSSMQEKHTSIQQHTDLRRRPAIRRRRNPFTMSGQLAVSMPVQSVPSGTVQVKETTVKEGEVAARAKSSSWGEVTDALLSPSRQHIHRANAVRRANVKQKDDEQPLLPAQQPQARKQVRFANVDDQSEQPRSPAQPIQRQHEFVGEVEIIYPPIRLPRRPANVNQQKQQPPPVSRPSMPPRQPPRQQPLSPEPPRRVATTFDEIESTMRMDAERQKADLQRQLSSQKRESVNKGLWKKAVEKVSRASD
ncbi:uncharacterized protein K452DRAFT_37108 [Aplosporella prunicola CBS 121167]|uniref:Uncharacterized protein n=1 Tax=Aplosporella prunicola CBS 121167 TaxID=1176127 RepID=A0A6A6BD71_9PEZI|nr:uncharacterized protein K452DRAFT_37108 [Aplosporella prunicola CBS 121167]KAF2141245.1 hypothetical protein K452DRAFT_37108 [Aplosporella prunicola CBS 121167]